jgi:hypothetical protein
MTTTFGVVNVDDSKNLITALGRLSVSAMCVYAKLAIMQSGPWQDSLTAVGRRSEFAGSFS